MTRRTIGLIGLTVVVAIMVWVLLFFGALWFIGV